jgi:hypothetical protein
MQRHDGAQLTIRRDIVGGDKARVRVTEIDPTGKTIRESDLSLGQRSMKDETGGYRISCSNGWAFPGCR